jgi:hypothetical protein
MAVTASPAQLTMDPSFAQTAALPPLTDRQQLIHDPGCRLA